MFKSNKNWTIYRTLFQRKNSAISLLSRHFKTFLIHPKLWESVKKSKMFCWKFEYVLMILAPLWLFWHCMGWFGLVWAARMGRNILHGLAWWTRGAIKTYNLRKSYSFWTKNLGAYWSLRATQKWCVIFFIWQWMENTLYILG